MSYALGVDLGATTCKAAAFRSGRASVVQLGATNLWWPAAAGLLDDGTVGIGDQAVDLLTSKPERVATGFLSRVGDETPLLFGGHLMRAEHLVGHQLRAVVDAVASAVGDQPAAIAVNHPAAWGAHRLECLAEAMAFSAVSGVELVPTPVAALRHYASIEPIADGAIVGVFDMGGSTVEASIVEWRATGPSVVVGAVRLDDVGGERLDDELFAFAQTAVADAALANQSALFDECVVAKVNLSSNTAAAISLGETSLRVTRGEFEAMIRPHLDRALDVLVEVAEAELDAGAVLDRVVLVGGSAAVPLIGQLVASQFGASVDLDVHPQHCTSLGLARTAAVAASLVVNQSTPLAVVQTIGGDAGLAGFLRPGAADAPTPPPPAPAPLAAALWPSAADAPTPPPL